MKKYRLKKDLPTVKAGAEFIVNKDGDLLLHGGDRDTYAPYIPGVYVLYHRPVLDIQPNILIDWFEQISEEPKTVYDLGIGNNAWFIEDGGIKKYVGMDEIELNLLRDKAEVGDGYITREDAEKELARRKARTILLRDTKGFKPDWKRGNQPKFYIYYDYDLHYLDTNKYVECDSGNIYFATYNDAAASIKAHEKEWKIYLGVEE